ncbi:MAG TPA: hypothetical protein VGG49_01510 [Steroidobacteraceae bacterium]|jgi:hypothetical protein
MLNTLTPIVAQSSEEASLINIGTLAFCALVAIDDPEPDDPAEPEDPSPHAVSAATMAPHTA